MILALALAGARFTVAAPSHLDARGLKPCSAAADSNDCAENEICAPNDGDSDFNAKVFRCVKKSELTKPWPRSTEGCSGDEDCDDGKRCIPGEGPLQILTCQVPQNMSCSTNADCNESQKCRADEAEGFNTEVLKCLDRLSIMSIEDREDIPSNGKCVSDSDCDGEGAACAYTRIYPKPAFGNCVGGNNDDNEQTCESNDSCPENMVCEVQNSLVDEQPKMKCVPVQDPEAGKPNEKRTSVLSCTEDYKCADPNKVCVARNFFFHEGPLNVCIGYDNVEEDGWCQEDKDCKGEQTCAPQTNAPRPMSGTCVVKN